MVDVACGIGQILANKGAVGVVLKMRSGKTLALVNAHLAAHQNKVRVYMCVCVCVCACVCVCVCAYETASLLIGFHRLTFPLFLPCLRD